MNREELIGKLQMVYVGDKNALNELTGYYDGLKDVIKILQQENARLKETFEKITNYIKEHDYDYIYLDCKFLETQIYNDLLQMLNKIKEN